MGAQDLTSSSDSVELTGLTPIAVDGHWLLAQRVGSTNTNRYVVRRLPFGAAQRPRLIGSVIASSFSPGGATVSKRTWRPAFDTTKPLTKVVLTIRNSAGTTVRTVAGSGPDGSIRTLSWNGKSTSGAKAKTGTYTWRLIATAADGEGAWSARTARARSPERSS